MNARYTLSAALACVFGYAVTMSAAAPEVPLAGTPLPLVRVMRGRTAASWENLGKEAETQFGFDLPRGSLPQYPRSFHPTPQELQAADEEARPFGEFNLYNGLHPGNILSARALLLGVAVRRRVWTARTDGKEGWPSSTSKVVWRWDAPNDMRLAWPRWTWPIYRERFAALCGVMDNWAVEPTLWLFDAAGTGPKWETTLPWRATYEAYCARTGQVLQDKSWGGDTPSVHPAVAHDGSRVLVWAGSQGPRASFLFVYDGEGKLLRVAEAPGYWALSHNNGVMRSPTAPFFALKAQRREKGAPGGAVDEYFLVNGEGEFLGRFVDDQGKPVAPQKLSNTHAYAQRKEKDGTYTEFIIRLTPGAP